MRIFLAGLILATLGLPGCFEGREVVGNRPGQQQDAGPEVPVPDGRRVRIAAFNVYRLFDTVCDSGACGGSDYEVLPSPEGFSLRASQLAAAIASLEASVVMVEEVETQASLDALRDRLPGLPWAVLGETGAPASVDVGVLSAWPITEVRGHRDQVLRRPDGTATTFSRELLEVHLDVEGTEVIVFAAHFKAKANDDPGRRLAEARAAHDLVAAVAVEHPRALVVLGGDLNDVPGSPPLQALEQDGALLRVASDRPDRETWTYAYSGDLQAIDHLLLARNAGGVYLPASFRAARDSSRGLGGSDHAAVVADFVLTP
ncbi:MAG TPA: endonuclease/exonuclease/phosphatase family protein [Archangium sp.]|jgi:predicted extracellular nuclease|uniref:endonuclease/exonuclease/phosphatase family protein n=1 Tax=Archangium sp. TaxID=1872627 RepID=UPI002ED8189A